MARTRTSDQTLNRHHAKRLVYACWLVLGITGPSVGAQAGGAAAGRAPDAVPCIPCQVLSVSADQVPDLPPSLAGLRLAVRASRGDAGWQTALDGLVRRHAAAGLHIRGVPDEQVPMAGAALDLLILEPTDVDARDL